MKKYFLIVAIALILSKAFAFAGSIKLSNDTLFCDLVYDEVGTLKSQTSDISDLNVIKTLVLSGYKRCRNLLSERRARSE